MPALAPSAFVEATDKVILFDGVCKLCHGWSRFIIHFDKAKQFKLATVQSAAGAAIMDHYQLQPSANAKDTFDTMYYIQGGRVYEKSSAFLQIMATMPYPWRLTSIFKVIPTRFRDGVYDFIASNRYKIFGRYPQCVMPNPDHEQRFLSFEKD